MTISTMSEMWSILDAYTLTRDEKERPVNHLNEWGGYSRRLKMPVFTAWSDFSIYDKVNMTTRALVCDSTWVSAVGVRNQERWLAFAEKSNDGVAAFFVIHAVDETASPRAVKSIDDRRAFVGRIARDGAQTFIIGQPIAV